MKLSAELEAAWARVEAGTAPSEAFGDLVMSPAEKSEIGARCGALAAKLRAGAERDFAHADALHSHVIARHVDRVEGNVIQLKRA